MAEFWSNPMVNELKRNHNFGLQIKKWQKPIQSMYHANPQPSFVGDIILEFKPSFFIMFHGFGVQGYGIYIYLHLFVCFFIVKSSVNIYIQQWSHGCWRFGRQVWIQTRPPQSPFPPIGSTRDSPSTGYLAWTSDQWPWRFSKISPLPIPWEWWFFSYLENLGSTIF